MRRVLRFIVAVALALPLVFSQTVMAATPLPGRAGTPEASPRPEAVAARRDYGAFSLPDDNPDLIVLDADITGVTALDFDRALAARPDARVVVLNSPGGSVESALTMARKIHRLGLATYVPERMGCYSACAYIFFAGANRQAEGDLGVHQISAEVDDLVFAQATLGELLDTLEDFGVAQPVISHMLRTPPDDMYVFSKVELTALGINRGEAMNIAFTLPAAPPPPSRELAYVELSSLASFEAAGKSRDYFATRWAKVLGDEQPRVDIGELGAKGAIYRVRVPVASLERANAICEAIRSDGGGCYVTTAR